MNENSGNPVRKEREVQGMTPKHRAFYNDDFGREIRCEYRKNRDAVELGLQCYGRLWAHMAGFAAINAGATMMQHPIFCRNGFTAVLPMLINAGSIFSVFQFIGWQRDRIKVDLDPSTETGRENQCRHDIQEEIAFEAENDICGLSWSFLAVQVIRFWLTGVLPNEEGMEEIEKEDDPWLYEQFETNQWPADSAIWGIFGIGFAFCILSVALILFEGKLEHDEESHKAEKAKKVEEVSIPTPRHSTQKKTANGHPMPHHSDSESDEEEAPPTCQGRVVMILLNATGMCFAWCVMWGTRWTLVKRPIFHIETIMGRVIMALMLSFCAFIFVFALDRIDDMGKGADGEPGNAKVQAQVIQVIVNALAILVGFSWEHCFDGGVGAIASEFPKYAVQVKFVLGIAVAILFVPLWRQQILTKEIAYVKWKDARTKFSEKQERNKDPGMTPVTGRQEETWPLVSSASKPSSSATS